MDAVNRGWYSNAGLHYATWGNTSTGTTGVNPLTNIPNQYNSFFVFDLSQVAPGSVINDATLRLEYQSWAPDDFETFGVFDVAAGVSDLVSSQTARVDIFNDLQSGNQYGTASISRSSPTGILELQLNPTALSVLNSATGGTFAIGIHSFTADPAFDGDAFAFSSANEPRIHQLVLNTTPAAVPEPGLLPLLLTGLFGLAGTCFRKRR